MYHINRVLVVGELICMGMIWWEKRPMELSSLSAQFFCKLKSLSHVQLFATPWSVQSMEFSRPVTLEWVTFHFYSCNKTTLKDILKQLSD